MNMLYCTSYVNIYRNVFYSIYNLLDKSVYNIALDE